MPAMFFPGPKNKKRWESCSFLQKNSEENKTRHWEVLESAVSLSKQTLTNRSFVGSRRCWQSGRQKRKHSGRLPQPGHWNQHSISAGAVPLLYFPALFAHWLKSFSIKTLCVINQLGRGRQGGHWRTKRMCSSSFLPLHYQRFLRHMQTRNAELWESVTGEKADRSKCKRINKFDEKKDEDGSQQLTQSWILSPGHPCCRNSAGTWVQRGVKTRENRKEEGRMRGCYQSAQAGFCCSIKEGRWEEMLFP